MDSASRFTKREANLRAALLALLDCVDHTNGSCRVTEPVGAVLPRNVIDNARLALKED